MDPDNPYPSIEGEHPPLPTLSPIITHPPNDTETATPQPATPLKKSVSRSPPRAQSPRSISRSPSVASARNDRQQSPALRTRQSLTNLSVSRSGTPNKAQYRRASSNLNPASPITGQRPSAMGPDPPHRKVVTPSMVAKEYFAKELERQSTNPSQTVVIVHDSCYGHRFSRPKTSKAALSTIVERPERILATLLGASTAYIRLGSHHAAGEHPPHPDKRAPPDSVPFQLRKITRSVPLNHGSVTAVHGSKWMEELQVMCDTAEAKLAMNGKELVRPIGYGKDETGKALPKLHEGDLYLCSETLSALQGCLGGICEAVDSVFTSQLTKRAFVCIRPPGHHCSSNFPSGFCWLNNVHVGISYAAMTHGLTHAAIIDFDLHHGDGSQTVTWEHNKKAQQLPKNAATHKKTPIGYYSLHDINSYPCEWGDDDKVRNASLCLENAHGQSIWNVHLEPWADHAEFWKLYETRYVVLLEKTRKFLRHHTEKLRQAKIQPKAAIFISAGFDASEWEGAGMQRHGVNVPTDFYARFTQDIVKLAQEDLAVDGRVISVLEGGYSDRALTSGVLSHICGLARPRDDSFLTPDGLTASMARSFNEEVTMSSQNGLSSHLSPYDPAWWNLDSLEWLEAIAAGKLPPVPSEKSDKATGNYSSPTHASSARMTDMAKERRSLTTQLEARLSMMEKPPPPPPDVDWAVASFELSRLIIPSDRQTLSCRHDELNAEATRVRKERQSAIGVAAMVPTAEPMQLRERRAKAPVLPSAPSRSSSRTRGENRRTTIASFVDLPDANADPAAAADTSGRPRRRSSAASSIVSGFSEMKLGDGGKDGPIPPVPQTHANANARPAPQIPMAKPKPTATRKPRVTNTKASVPSRPATKRANSGAPPLSRQSSNASERNSNALQPTSSNQSRQVSGQSDDPGDMDGITDAMKAVSIKSIKLNMPTEEQHAVNLKKREEEQYSKQTKISRKPPVPRNIRTKAPAKSSLPPVVNDSNNTVSAEGPSGDATPATAAVAQAPGPAGASVEAFSQPLVTGTQAPSTTESYDPKPSTYDQSASLEQPSSVQYPMAPPPPPNHSHQGPSPLSVMQDPPAANSLPNVGIPTEHAHPQATPTPNHWSFTTPMPPLPMTGPSARPMTPNRKTKVDLPVFTSTSPIPFSPRNTNTLNEDETKHEHEGRSIWDLPETPR